jgi:hypothetical protein
MFKIVKYILGAALISGATAAAASDLPPEVLESVMHSCRPDYHRVCSYVVPGDGRVGRCLLDHERELDPPCLKAIKLAYAIEVCLPDYHRYCDGVPRGPQAVECLAGRIESLGPECQRVVSANAPYIGPHGNQYGYAQSPAPYAEPYPGTYAYRETPRVDERYAYEREHRERPYDDRYADRGEYREHEQPYGDGRYPQRGYYDHGGDEPYPQQEEPEPIK